MTEEADPMGTGRIAIGVDVGGSGIKAAVVDVETSGLSVLISSQTPPPQPPPPRNTVPRTRS